MIKKQITTIAALTVFAMGVLNIQNAFATATVSPALNKVQTFIASNGVAGINTMDKEMLSALENSAKIVGKKNFDKAIEETAKAIDKVEGSQTGEVSGVKVDDARKALSGLIAGQLLIGEAIEGAKELAPDKVKLVQDGMKSLVFGKATQFLATGSAQGWSAESITGLARFIEVFSNQKLKGSSKSQIAAAFLDAAEAQAAKLNISVNAFLQQLISKCS